MVAGHRIASDECIRCTVWRSNGNYPRCKRIRQTGRIVCEANYPYIHRLWKSNIVNQCESYLKATKNQFVRSCDLFVFLFPAKQWNSGNLLTLGWSDSEELLCVQDDGLVLIYNMFGQYQHTFGMGQEAKDTKVIDAKIFPSSSGTGVAVMTSNSRIFLINSIKDPKIRQLPEMPSMLRSKLMGNDSNPINLFTIRQNQLWILLAGQ